MTFRARIDDDDFGPRLYYPSQQSVPYFPPRQYSSSQPSEAYLQTHVLDQMRVGSVTDSVTVSPPPGPLPDVGDKSWRQKRVNASRPSPPEPPVPWAELHWGNAHMYRDMVIKFCQERKFEGLWVVRKLMGGQDVGNAGSLNAISTGISQQESYRQGAAATLLKPNKTDKANPPDAALAAERTTTKFLIAGRFVKDANEPGPTFIPPEAIPRESSVGDDEIQSAARVVLNTGATSTQRIRSPQPTGTQRNPLKKHSVRYHAGVPVENLLEKQPATLPKIFIPPSAKTSPSRYAVAIWAQINEHLPPRQVGFGIAESDGGAEIMAWLVAGKNLEATYEEWCANFVTRHRIDRRSPVTVREVRAFEAQQKWTGW